MNNLALARRYRPQNLLDLKGQNVLVRALSYSLANSKLAQSYLLTGIRGVGKTTSARIIAKAANCTNLLTTDAAIACNLCNNCQSFDECSHPDIIEIDAASRTSIEDIKIIISQAEYKPLLGLYKIFIIDEVHMLSKSAFNALLKILEEPPTHIIFIFATTEVQKIPLTILSRCQRFNLSRLSSPELIQLLTNICRSENIQFELSAIELLAHKSDGSARDALSMLEQAAILSQGAQQPLANDKLEHTAFSIISRHNVEQMLGVSDKTDIIGFFKAVTNNDCVNAFNILAKIYNSNSDMIVPINELLEILAYILKKKAMLLSISSKTKDSEQEFTILDFRTVEQDIKYFVDHLSLNFLSIAWQLIFKCSLELKDYPNQLQLAEILAIKLIYVRTNDNNDSGSSDKDLLNNTDIAEAGATAELATKPVQSGTQTNNSGINTVETIAVKMGVTKVTDEKQDVSSIKIAAVDEIKNVATIKHSAGINSAATSSSFSGTANIVQASAQTGVALAEKKASESVHKINSKIDEEIFDFLLFLNSANNRELYYFLFNQAAITEFNITSSTIKIAARPEHIKYRQDIHDKLINWRSANWQVYISPLTSAITEVHSLKDIVKLDAEKSTAWDRVIKYFAQAEVTDILVAQDK